MHCLMDLGIAFELLDLKTPFPVTSLQQHAMPIDIPSQHPKLGILARNMIGMNYSIK